MSRGQGVHAALTHNALFACHKGELKGPMGSRRVLSVVGCGDWNGGNVRVAWLKAGTMAGTFVHLQYPAEGHREWTEAGWSPSKAAANIYTAHALEVAIYCHALRGRLYTRTFPSPMHLIGFHF